MEANAPKTPMKPCAKSYQLVHKHLVAIGAQDCLVGLSWDNTKLHPDWQLVYNAEKDAHFLVGAIEGPIHVADLDEMKKVMKDSVHQLGTKVRCYVSFSTTRCLKLDHFDYSVSS